MSMDFASDARVTPVAGLTPRHRDVELLAFKLWRDRGAPIGTPDKDWFRAEEELMAANSDADPALSVVAKTIGSALGSVAALVGTHR
jgi:hypothetical protein